MVEKQKKIDYLFDLKNRRNCTHCSAKQVSWACVHCDRTLPNGKWADLDLAAEDEDNSMFGRMRLFVHHGFLEEDYNESLYVEVKYVIKAQCLQYYANARQDIARHQKSKYEYDPPGWQWADGKLAAEDRPNSVMGVIRSLNALGLMLPNHASDWGLFTRNVSKTWIMAESFVDMSSTRSSIPAHVAEALDKYYESSVTGAWLDPAVLQGLYAYFNISADECEANPPAFSDRTKRILDQSYLDISSEDFRNKKGATEREETPRLRIGKPAKKHVEEMAKVVEDNNKRFEREKAAKEQKRKDHQAEKKEAFARKARAREEQRNALKQKAERRKQINSQRKEKEARLRGPWRTAQPSTALPVAEKPLAADTIREETDDPSKPNPIEDIGAVTEELIPVLASAPDADADVAVSTSPSDSSKATETVALSSVKMICDIDNSLDCPCEMCRDFDLAIDLLEARAQDEVPSQNQDANEVLSPNSKSFRSKDTLITIDRVASSSETIEEAMRVSEVQHTAFASQHDMINRMTDGERLKSTLDVHVSSSCPTQDAHTPQKGVSTFRLPRNSDLPDWDLLGLTAEAEPDSLFSRVWQLKALGAFYDNDSKDFGTIVSKFWKQHYLASQTHPNVLESMSLPNGSGSWSWTDLELSAEDREHSIFGATKKLVSLGFWSYDDEQALQSITMRVAKKWLVASSEEDHPSAAKPDPDLPKYGFAPFVNVVKNLPYDRVAAQASNVATAEPSITAPLPGLYRDGRLITSEVNLSYYSSSDDGIAVNSSDRLVDSME